MKIDPLMGTRSRRKTAEKRCVQELGRMCGKKENRNCPIEHRIKLHQTAMNFRHFLFLVLGALQPEQMTRKGKHNGCRRVEARLRHT